MAEVEALSACHAVRGEGVVIHNVPISWQQQDAAEPSTCTAVFHLSLQFCTERMLRFLSLEQNFQKNPSEQ